MTRKAVTTLTMVGPAAVNDETHEIGNILINRERYDLRERERHGLRERERERHG